MMEDEMIVAYAAKHEKGVSWSDFTREFEENRGWSHGKFVNHLKKAKRGLRKGFDEKGRPRWFAKDDETTRKTLLKTDIDEQRLSQASIPQQVVAKAILDFQRALFHDASQAATFLEKMKLKKKEAQFFKKWSWREEVRRYEDALSIELVYPEGRMPPEIPKWAFWLLVQVTLTSRGYPPEQLENLKIVLSYDSSKERKVPDLNPDAFAEWLREFKGEDIPPPLLKHLTNEDNGIDRSYTPTEEELVEYRRYEIEFIRKYASFQRMETRLMRERLRKTSPELYRKTVEASSGI
jgi:hypothetical protein